MEFLNIQFQQQQQQKIQHTAAVSASVILSIQIQRESLRTKQVQSTAGYITIQREKV